MTEETPSNKRILLSGMALGFLVGSGLMAWIFSIVAANSQNAGTADQVVLKLGHALDQEHPVHVAMEFMAQRAAELSGGKVVIEVFPNGQLGTETDCIEQVQRGALALVKTSTAPMEGFIPEMALFGLPYLFRDEDHYWKVLLSPIGQELLQKGTGTGMRGLCYYDSGSRSFYTTKKPILSPADLKGQKIRVMRSKMSMNMISQMGGSPTPIPWGELYTALQQGMVDGAENNAPSFFTSRHFEVSKFYSLDEHTRIPDIVLLSEEIWEKLTPQVQEWVLQAANESVEFQRKLWQEQTARNLEELQQAGVKVYYPDKEPFREIVKPLYAEFEGTEIGEYVKRIQAVQ
ncbi:MAG TPA: TRAP transporter substrate-binding protein [Oceanipulchritudo sp.]|nr:TRAP transporter substrate-binding protein [Oceanipulchritudo sp.]